MVISLHEDTVHKSGRKYENFSNLAEDLSMLSNTYLKKFTSRNRQVL
jgi:hypothetical protein